MKKTLALLLTLFLSMTVLFTGCGKTSQGDESASDGETESANDYQSAIENEDYEAALDAIISGGDNVNKEDLSKFLVLPVKVVGEDFGDVDATFVYNEKNLLHKIIEKGKNSDEVKEFTYDENDNVTLYEKYDLREGEKQEPDVVKTYTYDENGKLTAMTHEIRYGSTNSYTYSYNEKGLLVTEVHTSKEIHTSTPSVYTFTYTYDGNGNLLSRLDQNGYGCFYTYDEQNRKTSEVEFNSTGYFNRYTYTYDENGMLIKEKWESVSDASWWIEKTYKYDSNGTQYITLYSDGGDTEAYTYSYEFDSEGRLTTKTYRERDDKETRVTTFDKAGNILKIHRTKDDGSADMTYVYEYDKYGNRTKEALENAGNSSYSYEVTYEVKYYENGAPKLSEVLQEFKESDSIRYFF